MLQTSTNPQLHRALRFVPHNHGMLKKLHSLQLWMQRRPGCFRNLVLLVMQEPAKIQVMAAASILMSQAASLADIWIGCALLQSPEGRLSLAALTQT